MTNPAGGGTTPPPPGGTGGGTGTPVPSPIPTPTGTGSGTGTGDTPISIFNKNIASILTQLQTGAAAGRANLGGASDALTTESVGAAGGYDPTAAPDVNLQNQQGTLGAFAPAITSINTQLANTNAGISGLSDSIGKIGAEELPTQVSGGSSLVTPGGTTVSTPPVYNSSINPLTLQPYGWSSAPTGTSGSTPTTTGPLDSIFGSSNPMGAYADDPNYVSEISGVYGAIQSAGATSTPEALQSYIDSHAKGSPVTASMITTAANTYGIDAGLLAAVLQHESDFGTAGAAVKTMNPGNQGNTSTSTKTFASWQQGVLATAANIAGRVKAAATTSAGGSTGGSATGVPDINSDATALANGSLAPSVLQDRYTQAYGSAGGIMYNNAIAAAKKINPAFNETAANLKYQGQQTQIDNLNSGNPITNIFSNLENDMSTPSTLGLLSPAKAGAGTISNGVDLSQFNK